VTHAKWRQYGGRRFKYYTGVFQEVIRSSTMDLNLHGQRFKLKATRLRSRSAAPWAATSGFIDPWIQMWDQFMFHILCVNVFVCFWRDSPQWARASSFMGFLDYTQRRTTVGRTPLDEWSARRRNLYLTKYNTHNRQTSMPPVGIKPTISAG
jgi:hypothetical protein